MATPVLVTIVYSPWSERARWALQSAGYAYTEQTFIPMVSTFGLRLRTGNWRRPVTVPVLFADGQIIDDSYAIAKHGAPNLFTEEAAVRAYNAIADDLMEAGRLRAAERTLADDEALIASVPPHLRLGRRPTLMIGRVGARNLQRKYALSTHPDALVDQMRGSLLKLRLALQNRQTVLEHGFSYADIAMAVALIFVKPPAGYPIHPKALSAWTEVGLADEFADLLAWRDQLWRARA